MAGAADFMAVAVEAFTEAAAEEAPVEAVSAAVPAMQAEDIEAENLGVADIRAADIGAAPMEARDLSVAEPRTAAEILVAALPREVSERTGDRPAASADRAE